jgi:peptidoglycan/LPS O-acetylase OafA/YrhL
MSPKTQARKRRGLTYLWIAGLAAVVFILLWKEQTALLYVLATLGVTVLLVIVALANLDPHEGGSSVATVPDSPLSSRNRGPAAK